jgi:hypothetical protein
VDVLLDVVDLHPNVHLFDGGNLRVISSHDQHLVQLLKGSVLLGDVGRLSQLDLDVQVEAFVRLRRNALGNVQGVLEALVGPWIILKLVVGLAQPEVGLLQGGVVFAVGQELDHQTFF